MRYIAVTMLAAISWLPGQALAESKYCINSSFAAAGVDLGGLKDTYEHASIQILEGCSPGDTISLPGTMPALIGLICDFNKSIAVIPDGNSTITPSGAVRRSAVVCTVAKSRKQG